MNNGLGYKLANVPTITGLSTVTADIVNTEAVNTDNLYINGVDVSSIITQVPINTANIAALQQVTTDITYDSITDTTTIDNNVNINFDLYTAGNINCAGNISSSGILYTNTITNNVPGNINLQTSIAGNSVRLLSGTTLSLRASNTAVNIYLDTNFNSKNITGVNSITATTFNGTITTATNANNVALTSDDTAGTYYIPFSKTTSTTSNTLFIDDVTSPLTYNPSTSTLTCSNFSGNASTSTTSSTASTSNNIALTSDNTAGTYYIPFSKTTSATSNTLFIDDVTSPLTYNPSTGTLTASVFSGSFSGTIAATTVAVADDNSATTMYPIFTTTGAGQKSLLFDITTSPLSYTPSTGLFNALQYSINGSVFAAGNNNSSLSQSTTTLNIQNYSTSGGINFNTYDASNVNASRLQITTTSVQANLQLSTFDSVSSDLLALQASAISGAWNPNTPAGSSLIYAKSTAVDLQSLGLTVWSNTNTGLLINPANVRLGNGGTGATPTAYIDCAAGTTTLEGTTAINIRPKNLQFATSTGTPFTIGNGAGTNQSNIVMTNTSARTVAYTTGQNVVIGTDAGATTTTAFTASVLVGYGAGNTITSATDNVCIGNIAGGGITTGGANIFIGTGSGFQNLTSGTGGSNTCIGTLAGTGMTTTANGNCLIGAGVASAITTGANNTCLGTNSGDNITTGSSNITIGNLATVPTATSSNQIAIGTSSDTMYIRGGFNWRIGADITASITLTAPLAQYYSVTISAASQTITLPAPNNTTLLGQRVIFKRKTNNVQFTITSVGGGLVFTPVNNITLGTSQVVTTTIFQIELVCDGAAWAIISIA